MKNGMLILILAISLISCKKSDSNEVELLKDQFHGKYEILTAVSEDPVDLNMDGSYSTDLLSENSEIYGSRLELRIISEKNQLFSEEWPVETIVVPRGEKFDSTSYHSNYEVYYALYVNGISCQIKEEEKLIQLKDTPRQDLTNTLFSIESLTMDENNIIKVVAIRKLYTKKGWVKTKIESRYKRYTKLT